MQRFLLILLLLPCFSFGQITFQKTFGGDSTECIFSLQATNDGGYIMAGSTASFGAGDNDVYLIKLDSLGDTLWTKAYGEVGQNDGANSVKQTFDGGYIMAGSTTMGQGQLDIYLVKTDSIGNLQWAKTYGQPFIDQGHSVIQTPDSGYIVAGVTGTALDIAYVIKTNSNGDTLWTKRFDGLWGESFAAVENTNNGGFILVGTTNSFGINTPTYRNVYAVRCDSLGDTLWTRAYGGIGRDYGNAVLSTSDGGFMIAGTTSSFGAGYAVYLIKVNASGDTLWTKIYGDQWIDEAHSVKQTVDGGYIVAGKTERFDGTLYYYDALLLKVDPNGDLLWSKKYGYDTLHDHAAGVVQASDLGYMVAGCVSDYNEAYLIKTDANGYSGCNENNTNVTAFNTTTVVSPTSTILGSGGITVTNTNTTASNPATQDSTLCFEAVNIRYLPLSNPEFTLYPNPTSGVFTVAHAAGEIKVYDLFGRLVLRTNELHIDMGGFSKGLYFVRAGEAVRKLILR